MGEKEGIGSFEKGPVIIVFRGFSEMQVSGTGATYLIDPRSSLVVVHFHQFPPISMATNKIRKEECSAIVRFARRTILMDRKRQGWCRRT